MAYKQEEKPTQTSKPEKTRTQRIVNWFVAPVTGVITLLIVQRDFWPAPQLKELLAGIGISGEFAVVLCIAVPVLVLVAILAAMVVTLVEQLSGKSDDKANPQV